MRSKFSCASDIVKRSFSEHNREESKSLNAKGTQDKSREVSKMENAELP